MRILSLDISTTTIGYSVLDYNENNKTVFLFFVSFLKPLKKGSIFKKLSDVKCDIIEIVEKYSPDEVVIENIIEFIQQKSSSKTIISLAVINRVVGLTISELMCKEPHLLNVNSIRSIIKPNDYKGRIVKEQVPDILKSCYNIKFPYKLKKNGKIAPETYDMADGIAVGLAYIKKNFGINT